MVFVGFLKEEDKNIRSGKLLSEMFLSLDNDVNSRWKMLDYLSHGIFLTGVMSYVADNEGEVIGTLDYYTDGEFIWPVYYNYYLKKYNNFYIDNEFLKHAEENSYIISDISAETLRKIEKEFDFEWSGQWKKTL